MTCERLIVDVSDRKLSAIGVMDDVFFQRFPVSIPLMMFLKFKRNEGEPNQNLFLEIKVDNTVLGRNPIDFQFQDAVNSGGTILNLGFVPIPHPGDLLFLIFIDDGVEPICSLKYNVAQLPTAAQAVV